MAENNFKCFYWWVWRFRSVQFSFSIFFGCNGFA